MSNQHLNRPQSEAIADANALLAMSRRAGRQYAMYFVMIGAAGLVGAFVLFALSRTIGLVVATLIVLACILPMVLFIRSHSHLVSQLNRLAAPFWVVFVLALVLLVAGAMRSSGDASHTTSLLWLGGILSLLDGLAVGHFTDRASQRLTRAVPDAAVN